MLEEGTLCITTRMTLKMEWLRQSDRNASIAPMLFLKHCAVHRTGSAAARSQPPYERNTAANYRTTITSLCTCAKLCPSRLRKNMHCGFLWKTYTIRLEIKEKLPV